MAATLVGGAFLSSFVNVLFERLASPEVLNWLTGKKADTQKLLERLETSLLAVQAVLNDAEQRQITEPTVKMWLTKLEDAVFKADDLLDELRTRAATHQKDDAGDKVHCGSIVALKGTTHMRNSTQSENIVSHPKEEMKVAASYSRRLYEEAMKGRMIISGIMLSAIASYVVDS